MKPQLSTTMSQERLLEVCADPDWVVAEKMNGHRLLVEFTSTTIRGYARNGNLVSIPVRVLNALAPLGRSETNGLFLDGELITKNGIARYHVFDVIIGDDLPFGARWEALAGISDSLGWNDPNGVIQLVRTVSDMVEKVRYVQTLIRNAAEGIIARDVNAVYEPGHRSKFCCKYKLVKTVDAIVTEVGRDGKDNLILGLHDGDGMVEIGAVSALTGDGPLANLNDIVEVTYLAVGVNGKLIQPVTPRLRKDKNPEDCTLDQITAT